MGRKQKLRQLKKKKEASASTATSSVGAVARVGVETVASTTTLPVASPGIGRAPANTNADNKVASTSRSVSVGKGTGAGAVTPTTAAAKNNEETDADTGTLDHEFPKSALYVEAIQAMMKGTMTFQDIELQFLRGATDYGCIHSMLIMVRFLMDRPEMFGHRKQIHVAHPWCLEGAIRGSVSSTMTLVEDFYLKAQPGQSKALSTYWMRMINKYRSWYNGGTASDEPRGDIRELKENITRTCVVCAKRDTATVKLRQCMGCSTCCYCSQECQKKHWIDGGHQGECTQLKILNKYHKPYAKELRAATIRGESQHPRLEKLRTKLGLTRPLEEYQELRDLNATLEGTPINPYRYIVARKDGTVWIGSTPQRIPFEIK